MKLTRGTTSPVLGALLGALLGAGSAHARTHDLDRVLRGHVRGGRVDYAALRAAGHAPLQRFLTWVATAKPSRMTRRARLAFYLNAYNALVLGAVAERWPLASVKDVPGFFDKAEHRVAGRTLTLNQLENEVIRRDFGDARIHFALVCAARSCPPLHRRAFRAATVDTVLTRLTRRFITRGGGVQRVGETWRVSRLFEWYAQDFVAAAGSVGAFLGRYHPSGEALRSAPFDFQDYDWRVNARTSSAAAGR